MFGLSGLRLYAAIAGLALLLGALAWLVHLAIDRERLAGIVQKHEACTASLLGKKGAQPVTMTCEGPIVEAVEARDAGLACDAALAKPDPYQIRMTCSAAVKDVEADKQTVAANDADARAQLAQARAAMTAAVTRAETRVATANRRTENANQAAARAPRDGDGLIICAGDCLRALGGAAPVDAGTAKR